MHRAYSLPQFLIIGAQKCGTSWLHACLRQHPQVYLPADKDQEIDFRQRSQLAKLQQRLSGRSPEQLPGDACAAWFWTQRGSDPSTGQPRNIVDDIADVLGTDIRLILLVRNPVQRAISGYLHHVRHRSLDPNIGILDASPSLGITDLSRYGLHLHNWLQRFPADSLTVLPAPSEAATDGIFNAVLTFLQLPACDQKLNIDEQVMPGLCNVMQADGLWVRLDEACFQHVRWEPSVPIRELAHQPHVRLISSEEIKALTESLSKDTRWFLKQTCEHGWWHDAFALWTQP
ncbi:MAG: sulfotransferase domain-containing protein [Gammaproteobacteria bacterium]|nr:sulfotransferase domain-containing protein [Gammaproteobacteria bacterium]